jgi:hypothetical protein
MARGQRGSRPARASCRSAARTNGGALCSLYLLRPDSSDELLEARKSFRADPRTRAAGRGRAGALRAPAGRTCLTGTESRASPAVHGSLVGCPSHEIADYGLSGRNIEAVWPGWGGIEFNDCAGPGGYVGGTARNGASRLGRGASVSIPAEPAPKLIGRVPSARSRTGARTYSVTLKGRIGSQCRLLPARWMRAP